MDLQPSDGAFENSARSREAAPSCGVYVNMHIIYMSGAGRGGAGPGGGNSAQIVERQRRCLRRKISRHN